MDGSENLLFAGELTINLHFSIDVCCTEKDKLCVRMYAKGRDPTYITSN